jgi:hypothetical protein
VNGFRPLFRPNNFDPMYEQPSLPSAIQNQNSLPPGFRFSTDSSLMTPNSYPKLKAPSLAFSSPSALPDYEDEDVTSADDIGGHFGIPYSVDEEKREISSGSYQVVEAVPGDQVRMLDKF